MYAEGQTNRQDTEMQTYICLLASNIHTVNLTAGNTTTQKAKCALELILQLMHYIN